LFKRHGVSRNLFVENTWCQLHLIVVTHSVTRISCHIVPVPAAFTWWKRSRIYLLETQPYLLVGNTAAFTCPMVPQLLLETHGTSCIYLLKAHIASHIYFLKTHVASSIYLLKTHGANRIYL